MLFHQFQQLKQLLVVVDVVVVVVGLAMFSARCQPSVQSSSKQDYNEDTRKKDDVRRGGSHTQLGQ